MTVVLDPDTGRVIWCGKGHGKEVLESFFDLLDEGQRASIEVVTADGARWIADVVADRCPNAERVMDPFHIVAWMTEVLDGIRKQAWRDARAAEAKAKKKRGEGAPRKATSPSRARRRRSREGGTPC